MLGQLYSSFFLSVGLISGIGYEHYEVDHFSGTSTVLVTGEITTVLHNTSFGLWIAGILSRNIP